MSVPPRRVRRAGWGLAATSAAGLAAGAGVAMHYARRLTDPPGSLPEDPPADDDRVAILSVGDDHVVLAGAGAARPGTWGVVTETGYGRVEPVTSRLDGAVRRPFSLLQGSLERGEGVLDAYAFPNRADALSPDGHEVLVDADVGPLPAHHVPGDDTWLIGVHGRAAWRHETFRAMTSAVAAGHSTLAISYRNDRDAPTSPDGRSHLGGTEWLDVLAAMSHARRAGARRLVLVGCSMGGAIVGQVLVHAPADDVAGIILDAPVVDWGPVVARAAREMGLPRPAVSLLVRPTAAAARARHRVDLASLRFDAEVLDVPTLLVHGAADDVVPIEGSDALAAARPDVVTMLRVPGAGHVKSWNADRATYDVAVATLLAAVTPAPVTRQR